MANVLTMAMVQSIQQLHAAGWSQRRIARELEIDRGTVARHLRPPRPAPKAAIVPTGSDGPNAATLALLPASAPPPTPGNEVADGAGVSKAAILPTGSVPENAAFAPALSPGRPSQCEPYRALIQSRLDQRLSAQRIWQDLRTEHGFIGYDSVKWFVRQLPATTLLPFQRMECGPGEKAQVDFGGAPIVGPEGKRRKTNVFRIVLSHRRKA